MRQYNFLKKARINFILQIVENILVPIFLAVFFVHQLNLGSSAWFLRCSPHFHFLCIFLCSIWDCPAKYIACKGGLEKQQFRSIVLRILKPNGRILMVAQMMKMDLQHLSNLLMALQFCFLYQWWSSQKYSKWSIISTFSVLIRQQFVINCVRMLRSSDAKGLRNALVAKSCLKLPES